MDKPNGLDRKSLQNELENYRLIAEVNSELVHENLSIKEELAKKIELAQNCIDKSNQWEGLGEQTKSHDALSNAKIVVVEVNALIKLLLGQDTSWDDSDLQWGQSSVYG